MIRKRPAGAVAVVLMSFCAPAAGQSLLQRTPNLSGGWEATPGTVYFNFLHRFVASPAPARKVSNYPTFLLGAGLPGNVLLAANYSTNSDLVTGYPNEWEFFARAVPLTEFRGFPADVGVQGGYNLAAESFDFEVSLVRQLGPVRLIGAGRALSKAFGTQDGRFVVAAGGVLKLNRWLALAADIARPTDLADSEEGAWSAGVHMAIPFTPHSLSLQVANTNTGTLQGSSRGTNRRRYGFEFTVPVTLARYFGRRSDVAVTEPPATPEMPVVVDTPRVSRDTVQPRPIPQPRPDTIRPPVRDTTRPPVNPTQPRPTERPPAQPPAQQRAAQPQAPRPVTVRMRQLNFEPRRISISAGTAVVWRNDDQVVHTVKAANGSWESPFIQPGGTYRRTFSRAGTYEITCGPHPFMKQIVEVK